MPDVVKMVGVLFIACGLSAGSLAVVNRVTREPIAGWERKQKEAALREVFARADQFKEVTPGQRWEAWAGQQQEGQVFLTRVPGYSGSIEMMFGTDADGAITALKVLSHTETPGLGAKITGEPFRNQFRGLHLEQVVLRKDDPSKGQVDAITAATISSRAVTRAVAATLAAAQGKGAANP